MCEGHNTIIGGPCKGKGCHDVVGHPGPCHGISLKQRLTPATILYPSLYVCDECGHSQSFWIPMPIPEYIILRGGGCTRCTTPRNKFTKYHDALTGPGPAPEGQ